MTNLHHTEDCRECAQASRRIVAQRTQIEALKGRLIEANERAKATRERIAVAIEREPCATHGTMDCDELDVCMAELAGLRSAARFARAGGSDEH